MRRDDKGGGGPRWRVSVVPDAALGRVLVRARAFDDELDSVAGDVGFEGGGHVGPGVGAGVGDDFRDGEDGDDVGGGASEEEESYEFWGGRLVRVGGWF